MKFLLPFIAFFFFAAFPAQAEVSGDRLLIVTEQGSLLLGLYDDAAPATTAQIRKLVAQGLFDMVPIVRIEGGFVVQTAEVWESTAPHPPDLWNIIPRLPLEGQTLHHRRGILSLAHGDDPASGQSSFSILLGDAPHLDGKYTPFGEVLAGWGTITRIEGLLRDERNKPSFPLHILTATLVSAESAAAIAETLEVEAKPSSDRIQSVLLSCLAVIALAVFILAPRLGAKSFLALQLLTLLLSGLGLMVMSQPSGTVAGGLAFAGLIGLFRVFSSFENRPS